MGVRAPCGCDMTLLCYLFASGRIMTDRSSRLVAKRQVAHALRALPRTVGTLASLWLGFVLTGTLGLSVVAEASDIVSYAIVQDDGSLRVRGKTIRLFGVYMPPTERGCRSDFRPPLCGNRSVRALKLKIRGFVRCAPQADLSDGSLSAVCYVDGDSVADPPVDLGAWLIEQGLAVAGPGAPFEYQTLERIAQVNRRGVWGLQVDQIIR
jgi:endonuclease YncB( thermonuclease family)